MIGDSNGSGRRTCRWCGDRVSTADPERHSSHRRCCETRRIHHYEYASSGHRRKHTPSQSRHCPATDPYVDYRLVEPLVCRLKLHSNGPLYSSMVTGRLAIDVLAPHRCTNISTATVPTSYHSRWHYNYQGSENRVDTHKNPPKKHSKKTHPKFDPVSFLLLLITKDFIMFKASNSTSSEFAK